MQQLAEPSTDFQLITDAQQRIVSEIQQFSSTTAQYLEGIIGEMQAATERLSQQIGKLAMAIASAAQVGKNSAQPQPITVKTPARTAITAIKIEVAL